MSGAVALVGAGEFLPIMASLDRQLLDATGASRPRVVVVPTASWPDGEDVFRRWAAMGVEHFRGLGAEVEAVAVRDAGDAYDPANVQAVGEADLVYFSGGKPDHLLRTLEGSPFWSAALAAHERGAVLAGCSAGAMVLADRQPRLRRRVPFLVVPMRWERALCVVPGVALQAPRGTRVLGIDEDTALVGRDGSWQVHGRGRVTVWEGRHRVRLRNGDVFRP